MIIHSSQKASWNGENIISKQFLQSTARQCSIISWYNLKNVLAVNGQHVLNVVFSVFLGEVKCYNRTSH